MRNMLNFVILALVFIIVLLIVKHTEKMVSGTKTKVVNYSYIWSALANQNGHICTQLNIKSSKTNTFFCTDT